MNTIKKLSFELETDIKYSFKKVKVFGYLFLFSCAQSVNMNIVGSHDSVLLLMRSHTGFNS